MPFTSKIAEKEYRQNYQRGLRDGKRARDPETLAEALQELTELRRQVQQQRKRIWFLENKESMAAKQRARRRAGFDQNVMATLAAMQERGEIIIKNTSKNTSKDTK